MSEVLSSCLDLLGVEQLPDDWNVARLGEVTTYAKRPRGLKVTEPTPFIPMGLIPDDEMNITSWEMRDASAIASGTYFEASDLLVGRITPCFENGKQGIVPPDIRGGWGFATTEVYALRSDELDMRYLHLFLKIDAVRTSLIEAMEGATGRMRLPKEALEALPIAWPSHEVQVKLVEAIDVVMGQSKEVVAELNRSAALARTLQESLLEWAIRGQVTTESPVGADYKQEVLAAREAAWRAANPNKKHYPTAQQPEGDPDVVPDGWVVMSLDELTTGARSSAYGVLQPGEHVDGGLSLVRVGDISSRHVRDANLKTIDPEIAAAYGRTQLRGGELLVSLVGTIGRCGVVPATLEGANVARAIGMFPLGEKVDPEFISITLSAPSAQARLIGAANEVARKTLNLNDLRKFPIALPPLTQQQAIVERVAHLEETARDAVDLSLSALEDLGHLRQSILRDAVTGRWPRHEAAKRDDKNARVPVAAR